MGLLLKVILFGLVFYYIVKTIGSFVFRFLGGHASQQQQKHANQHSKEGEINIDYMPQNRKRNSTTGSGSKDGDYIDYEEVK